jgi:multiple RNA-binding domain-containing protein 1
MTRSQDDEAPRSTTRVCIKNVPLSFTEEKLRQHLVDGCSVPLKVTDCRILKTKDGKSRKLAFCGFSSEGMALTVVREFHQTYALTSKLSVEPAFNKKDSQQHHRPWSQHSEGSSRYQAKHHVGGGDQDDGNLAKDGDPKKEEESNEVQRRKEEFLAAMGAVPSKPKFWANDDGVQEEEHSETPGDCKQDQDEMPPSSSSDDDSSTMSDVDSVDSRGEGANALTAATSKPAHGAVVSDMDFLRSKVTAAEDLSDSDSSDNSDGDDDEIVAEKASFPAEQPQVDSDSSSSSDSSSASSDDDNDGEGTVAAVAHNDEDNMGSSNQNDDSNDKKTDSQATQEEDPHRLFVRNLPFTTTEEELQQHFEPYGEVKSCHIPIDDQKRNKGFAFIAFSKSNVASRVKMELDGTDFQGRLLHILPARRGSNVAGEHGEMEGLTYKEKQELGRQKEALFSSKGWSASFVRADAVVDNLADRLGLRKGDILNVKDGLSSGEAAVRLALGETHIIEENREFFRQHGVDMDALVSVKGEAEQKRSTTSILVKNLPYDTELEELTKVFHDTNPPQRILLPPSRTIAMVDYGHAADARRAFRKLAYRRFKHVPLYLEWAPLAAKVDTTQDMNEPAKAIGLTTEKEQSPAEEEPTEPGESHTIYVKNLNFATTQDELKRVFLKHVKSIRAVKIPTKTVPTKKVRDGGTLEGEVKSLSMGFGFVECDSDESVRKAIKALQGTIVDGHKLELMRSTNRIAPASTTKRQPGANPTKLMVRNVPFEATRKELLQLFGSFGQLKKVRLPKKFDGTHRGFAFVEFLTNKEAQTAMNTLSRTHLYGRHLVLEWASDKDDMDTLREKAQRDVLEPPKNKKIRFQ